MCYVADFFPLGQERTPILNSCAQNYKFSGKERDTESGLDNFEARYDSSTMGRFMSVDPLSLSDRAASVLGDPQSGNASSYVRNNPLNLTDPNGMLWCTANYNTCTSDVGYTFLKQHGEIGPALWMLFTHHIEGQLLKDLAVTPAQFMNLVQRLAQHQGGAQQAVDSFNATLGFEKTNCAGGGDCISALGMAATASIAAVY